MLYIINCFLEIKFCSVKMLTYLCVRTHTWSPAHAHTHMHTYIHTCIHTYVHIYIYMYIVGFSTCVFFNTPGPLLHLGPPGPGPLANPGGRYPMMDS